MRDLVEHPASGLVLDFGRSDFGGAAQREIIADWRGRTRRPLVAPREFVCVQHRDRERPGLYLKERGNVLFAAHWPHSGCGSHSIIHHGTSPEHERQVEYLRAAGEAAGHQVRTEVRLATSVRPDAVIYGPAVHMGVEVQRSGITVAAARSRTTRARHAGVDPVWFADARSDPQWLFQVPGVRMNPDVSWDDVPRRGTVTVVSGLREIAAKRCRDFIDDRCPRRRSGCNEWHPDHTPRLGVKVDDLAALMPAGNIVPMQFQTLGGTRFVFIVTPKDRALYESITHLSGALPLRERPPSPRDAARIDCGARDAALGRVRPAWLAPRTVPEGTCGHFDGVSGTYCGGEGARRYLQGHRCDEHSPAALRRG